MSFHKRGKVLRGDAREIVYSVIQYFEEEKNSKRYHPYKHSNLRAALATGLSASTISKIRKEGKLAEQLQTKIRTPNKGNRGKNNTRVPISLNTLCSIREIIAVLYDHGVIPTTTKIIARLKKDLNFNFASTTLRRILKDKLGYKYKKCSKNIKIPIESDKTKACRAKYLRRIRNNDTLKSNKKPLIYFGESAIEVTHNKIKGKKNLSQRYFLIQAFSENGYLRGSEFIFKANNANEIDTEELKSYVRNILVKILPKNCLLVLDNSSFKNTQVIRVLSSLVAKEEIRKWMVDNYITFEDEWTKSELIIHIINNKSEKKYVLDELLSKYGHETLRLPPFSFDLNPIKHVFDKIKEKVVKLFENTDEINLENIAKEALTLVTEDVLKNEVERVKSVEKKYWLREVVREEKFEEFIKSLGVNCYDGTDEETNSSEESMEESDSSMEDDDE